MFEKVDGRWMDRRTMDAWVTGIQLAHLVASSSGELKKTGFSSPENKKAQWAIVIDLCV